MKLTNGGSKKRRRGEEETGRKTSVYQKFVTLNLR
jgi:hypothetical protein